MMRQIVLDTETTGLKPEEGHRIIEIGGVELINRRLTGKHFHVYLNPQRKIDEEAKKIHGITEDFLQDKPLFADIAEEFMTFIKSAELIIHNAPFDVGFINWEFALLKSNFGKAQDYCRIFDTLSLARQMHPGQRNNLDALCKRYSVDNSNRQLHGALLDAEILAEVYLLMTGGQGSLFGDDVTEQAAINKVTSIKKIEANSRAALPIIQPTAEELIEHQAFLEMLKNKSGKTVNWEN